MKAQAHVNTHYLLTIAEVNKLDKEVNNFAKNGVKKNKTDIIRILIAKYLPLKDLANIDVTQ